MSIKLFKVSLVIVILVLLCGVSSSIPVNKLKNPYDYIDVFFEVSDVDETPELRVGFPANISELSTLGKVLKKAGMDFIENEEIKVKDIKDLLMDREVTFLINNEKTDAGEFARILRDTIEFN